MYINCPGGSVSATLAIYDTMQFLECPIATYCMGMAASGAAILLAAGTKGRRYRPAELQDHDPPAVGPGRRAGLGHRDPGQGDPQGPARLNEILAKHTGQPIDMIDKETERDRYFSRPEAKEFGLVDEVLTKQSEAKKTCTQASVSREGPTCRSDRGSAGLTFAQTRRTTHAPVPFVV